MAGDFTRVCAAALQNTFVQNIYTVTELATLDQSGPKAKHVRRSCSDERLTCRTEPGSTLAARDRADSFQLQVAWQLCHPAASQPELSRAQHTASF